MNSNLLRLLQLGRRGWMEGVESCWWCLGLGEEGGEEYEIEEMTRDLCTYDRKRKKKRKKENDTVQPHR